jgi:pyruvate kinase
VASPETADRPIGSGSGRAEQIWQDDETHRLIDHLVTFREQMASVESSFASALEDVHPDRRVSAKNLLHYAALRQHDIRPFQEQLVQRGLSSLGRCEAYVAANVETVLGILGQLSGRELPPCPIEISPAGYHEGRQVIDSCTERLLGERASGHGASIMVTMPSTAAEDYDLVHDLLATGMDVMRINCAHDGPEAWSAMIANLRRAEQDLGRHCRVAMDLGGPKIRTGPIEPGPAVVRWQPHRDSFGRIVAPARIWLTNQDGPLAPMPASAELPVAGCDIAELHVGDEIRFDECSGRPRRMRVVELGQGGCWAECNRTCYLAPDDPLQIVRPGTDGSEETAFEIRVGMLPPGEQFLVLYRGDRLMLTSSGGLGRPAKYDDRGRQIQMPQISCTLPEIFADLRRGERVLFDDGKIEGVIEEVCDGYVVVGITRARNRGEKLRSDKGINLPDSDLQLPALSGKDIEDLGFVVEHADIVSYSFVRRVDDIRRLQSELERLGRPDLGIILKIENRQAFENLPQLLLAVMRSPATGVMIARGDLAVECGYQRMAELQEEILWLCEAAHMPVVWATQVLEGLAKRGFPTRAEVTDAAMGVRAECVMLNKGPYIVEAVRTLDDILRRMQGHQVKKRQTLRRLKLADNLFSEASESSDWAN